MRAFRWILVSSLALAALAALPASQGQVAEVQVAPAAVRLAKGASQRLHAVAYDAQGNVIVAPTRYHWSSANVNVARVDTLGTVTAVAPGSALVRAEVAGSSPPKSGAATVTVRR
jgi:uncharacterized protein YjdB